MGRKISGKNKKDGKRGNMGEKEGKTGTYLLSF